MRPRALYRWTVALAAVAALVLVVFLSGACSALGAARLLGDALDPPVDIESQTGTRSVVLPVRGGDVELLVVAPREDAGRRPAVVLVHGAVDAGARDPRLLRFARALAARGAVVVVPHLPSLAAFRMDPLDPARLADVGRWIAADSGEAEDGRVAFAGVSVGGSY